jgi:uncharacterized membrane protein YuzA (DUF378 family)
MNLVTTLILGVKTFMDYVIIGIIALLTCLALAYIIKAKKHRKKCIGCPDGCSCNCQNCPEYKKSNK